MTKPTDDLRERILAALLHVMPEGMTISAKAVEFMTSIVESEAQSRSTADQLALLDTLIQAISDIGLSKDDLEEPPAYYHGLVDARNVLERCEERLTAEGME